MPEEATFPNLSMECVTEPVADVEVLFSHEPTINPCAGMVVETL